MPPSACARRGSLPGREKQTDGSEEKHKRRQGLERKVSLLQTGPQRRRCLAAKSRPPPSLPVPPGGRGRERGGSCHRPRRPRRHARSCTRTGLPPWPSAAAGRTPPIVPCPRPPLRHDSPPRPDQTRPPDPLPRCRLLGGKRKNGGYTLGSRVCVCVFLGWRTHTPANCVGGSF